ncbi:MAG: protease HtpX [Candidatus Rokubacteria bacterium RIFCSPHIGHO2_12_FULL_73_22]|nr:MAG: protease HtpX [Candidatus Rokubacteria bacterium RIFCSPHIGHO2_12_FULL_73_22]OGL28879.1 MAG: protease HtpX [Candidatus Rokubacteria bacterium RIFCSPLOWO2_12_FULL_73_47]
MSNVFKTGMLLAVLTAMLVLLGGALGGERGMLVAFVLAAVMNFVSYWFSDRIVLAMYGAQPVDEAQAPGLHAIVRRLATRAGLPMPRLYLIPSDTPNAFATGRDPQHAVVAVTAGILRVLEDAELEGVLAHELAHVKNRDVLISTVAATLAGAITYLAHMAQWAAIFGGRSRDDDEGGNPVALILLAVLAPIAALLVQLAVSRGREFQADATGARVAGHPQGLIGALQKLERANEALPMAQANPATAHLFIVNPLSGQTLARLFSTHPPLEERIARLHGLRG